MGDIAPQEGLLPPGVGQNCAEQGDQWPFFTICVPRLDSLSYHQLFKAVQHVVNLVSKAGGDNVIRHGQFYGPAQYGRILHQESRQVDG